MGRRKRRKKKPIPFKLVGKCPNCGTREAHFVPPSFGDKGLFICENHEIYYCDDIDGHVEDDHEFFELIMKRAIARQGPQYSKYQSCMWD